METEERAEKVMDEYLKSVGLHRKKIAKDGSCLFRAVAEQVLHCQSLHTKVRAECVDFLRLNRSSYEAFIEGDFEEYLCKLQDPQQWVGEVEIHALAIMYKRDFQIFQDPGKPAVNITDHNFKDKVRLCFLNGNHYDSVYPVSHIKNAALCQSILYELLYDDVLKVDRSSLSVCQRTARPHDLIIDDNMAACASSDESDNGEQLWIENGTNTTAPRHNRGRGRGRLLSERVRRSLNPTLFRNIDYDVWHKTKRAQQKLDYCIAAGMQFSAGDRCQVRLEGGGRSYNATVKEVPPDNGPVTVFIEELGKKQVPLWSLRPPSDENSWSTVVNRDKRLSNGQGDWEERSKGRGRGKHVVAASSSVPLPAPGSSGRVLKQHSWPPQATVEEQGGTKTTRKSVSTVESSFGLTEEQRLAKEEEKRNVALVEIQLRDEHSFPALGCGTEGGRKKGGEKKKPQRNKTKSPVEEVRAPSPSAGERPKSSTPPLTTSPAASAKTTTPTDAIPTLPPPAANSDSTPASLSSHKASAPKTNAPATAASAAPDPTVISVSATRASSTSPPLPPAALTGGAIPSVSFITPVLPPASSSSSSQPPKSSPSPPPSSSLPLPTFIAPVAPSPAAAQSFLHPSSLTRSSPPLSCLPRPPSPPPPSSSSSSLIQQTAQVHDAPPAPTPSSLPNPGGAPTAAQTPENQGQPQTPSCPPQLQSHTEVPQVAPPVLQQTPSHPQYLPQSQPDVVQSQSSYPLPSQASDPVSQPPDIPPPSHLQPPQPSLQRPTQTEVSHPPAQPLADSPARPQPPPSNHPQSHLAHPPLPTPMQGAVPLQQLSQLYQDPLYPGFPQGEKGQVALPPPMSYRRSGDDLPQDVNILRFFFNLGLKAYSMPIVPPYVYLLPLQQTHTMHPRITSRSPSPIPHYPSSNPPSHPQYPPTSASMPPLYDHQAPPTEHPHHSDPSYNQPGYPVSQPPTHRMPQQWLQHQMPPPRNPNFPVAYPSPNPQYAAPPAISQGYHQGQSSGHPLYPSSMSPYPPSSLGYEPSSTSEELQVSQGAMEQHRPSNGHIMAGQRPVQGPGVLGSPPASNAANAKNNITVMVPGFGHKKEHGERVTRAVMLGEPPVNNPMLMSNPGDVPVSMTTMKPSSTPGTSLTYEFTTATPTTNNNPSYGYRGYPKPINPTNTCVPLGVAEPSQVDYMANVAMTEGSSVGCSTEDDWDEQTGFKQMNYRGQRRYQRGGSWGRGRANHDSGRGANRRRYGADGGPGSSYVQFNSSHRGRGRERGY